jgi:hypothetical protein
MLKKEIHSRCIETATRLSRYFVPNFIGPLNVVHVLNRHRIAFVLVGLHGICGWMDEPRAHADVDVIVARRDFKYATGVLEGAFRNIQASTDGVLARLRDKHAGNALVDVFRSNGWYGEVFRDPHYVVMSKERFRIPSLEMALAMRFREVIDSSRPQADRYLNAHDFVLTVKVNSSINLARLTALCNLAWRNGGWRALRMVRKIRGERKVFPLEALLS